MQNTQPELNPIEVVGGEPLFLNAYSSRISLRRKGKTPEQIAEIETHLAKFGLKLPEHVPQLRAPEDNGMPVIGGKPAELY